jgi:hypothetical protein
LFGVHIIEPISDVEVIPYAYKIKDKPVKGRYGATLPQNK